MTGRGMGLCSACGNIYYGRGRGRGLGIRRFWASPKNDVQDLKDIKTQLEEELKAIKDEIASIEKQEQ
jgi:hypothetical protein